jgi:hypothetical protein
MANGSASKSEYAKSTVLGSSCSYRHLPPFAHAETWGSGAGNHYGTHYCYVGVRGKRRLWRDYQTLICPLPLLQFWILEVEFFEPSCSSPATHEIISTPSPLAYANYHHYHTTFKTSTECGASLDILSAKLVSLHMVNSNPRTVLLA